jgi:hypothetical protein
MLFDIRGRRKRVIQVIYVGLALLMGGGLIFFGIGSSTSGGLFDALGGGSGSSDPQFDNQIERSEDTLKTDPRNEKALLALAQAHFLKGQTATEVDDQGQRVATDETESEFQDAIDAWERYLATKPDKPDDGVATLIFQAYQFSASADDPPDVLKDEINGAYATAVVVADAQPTFGSYVRLASAAYLAGKDKEGEAARKKALAEADDSTSKGTLEKQLKFAQQQGKVIAALIAGKGPSEPAPANPLEGLGGSGTTLPGAGTTGTTLPGAGATSTTSPPGTGASGGAAGGDSGSGGNGSK